MLPLLQGEMASAVCAEVGRVELKLLKLFTKPLSQLR